MKTNLSSLGNASQLLVRELTDGLLSDSRSVDGVHVDVLIDRFGKVDL
jgi:hypothetical protein